MNKIKQQFSDLRKNTPKHIQWLLLAAAFIVVLILLTLLLTGRNNTTVQDIETVAAKLNIDPDIVDWGDTKVGEKRTQTIKITASAPVNILKIRLSKEISGFPVPRQTCTNGGKITKDISCSIFLEYEPGTAATPQGAPLYVDWRNADEPDEMFNTEKIMITLGAVAPEPEKKPDPKPEPKPVVEPAPVKEEIKREIESIAPAAPLIFEEDDEEYIESVAPVQKTQPQADTSVTQSEACSDFAFPGYNASGNQIGWIKPERGAYYFHPFSDKKCDTPTGVYNPDNGIITSIDGKGTKIGTDAEHIGYTTIVNGTIPQLSNAPAQKVVNRAEQSDVPEDSQPMARMMDNWQVNGTSILRDPPPEEVLYSTSSTKVVASTQPYDRTFILRQYKPISATIVSDIRADAALVNQKQFLPVRATVDRNVYSDNGRTVIIPTGTLLLGYVTGDVPGPYKSIGRMEINWYQFVLPNGVEFNFKEDNSPFSGDSQGRVGVPGRGSTDYLEQFVMPMLTAIVPAAVNMIAPVADKFVNQIDLDNNTVVQSGTLRSSELAKNEIITAWNQVAQKLMVDMMDNTVPPFTIPAGTRITVYSPEDLAVVCLDNSKKCSFKNLNTKSQTGNERTTVKSSASANYDDGSWIGQARSFNMEQYCIKNNNDIWEVDKDKVEDITKNSGYSYSTVVAYCQSKNYQAKNMARQEQLFLNQQSSDNKNSIANISSQGQQAYNEQVLGLKYDEDTGAIQNPFQSLPKEEAPATITCEDGTNPDANGCCTGEIFTDMGEQGFNCCPESGGDCFPPIL